MNRRCLAVFLAAALIVAFASDVRAQNASPEDILRQYVADLQKNPNDYALREKIIRHVQTMKPAPVIPESARRHYVKGSTLYDDSKNPSESADASEEFRQSLLIAPWWGDAYMKMGLALESSKRYDEAIAAIKLFIATNPKDDVVRKAQDEIYKIEARAQKAAKPPMHSPAGDSQSTAERKQDPIETLLRKIDGRRYRATRGGPAVLEVRGKSLALMGPGVSGGPWEIIGRIARTARVMQSPPLPVQTTFTISEAGDRIIEHREFSDGDVREFTWLWQR